MAKKAQISIFVELDDEEVPEKITWQASDSQEPELKECDSFSLSLWDSKEKNTLGIDLWSKKMVVLEMYQHISQMLQKMANTAERSTGNNEIAELLREFSKTFVTKVEEVLEKEEARQKENTNV